MTPAWELEPGASPNGARTAIEQCGFVVLRGALDREAVLTLSKALEAEFSRLQGVTESLPEELRKSLSRSELPADEQLARFRLEPARYAHLTASKRLTACLREIAQEDFLWHYPPMFRRVSGRSAEGCLPFHQDYTYNRKYAGLLTCFTPLNDCGIDSPGLELVEKRVETRLDHAADGLWEFGLPEEKVAELFPGAQLHRPALRAGDVVVFDHHTLHRTHHHPSMTGTRQSMDARAIPLSCIDAEVRKQRKFILPEEAAFAKPL
jgi:hypothetical protein